MRDLTAIFVGFYEYETKCEIKNILPRGSMGFLYLSDISVISQLSALHKIANESTELYGTYKQILEYFKRFCRIEQFEFSDPYAFPKYTDVSGNIICSSTSDLIRYMKLSLEDKIKDYTKEDLLFYSCVVPCGCIFEYFWYLTELNNMPKYHKIIADDSWKSLYDKLCDLCNVLNMEFYGEHVEDGENENFDLKLFDKFKECEDSKVYIDKLVKYLKYFNYWKSWKSVNFKKAYKAVLNIHNQIKPLRKELMDFLGPEKKASPDFKSVIRRFKGANYEFYLAREVRDAFPEENITLENEEDMKQKRVFTVDSLTFDRILEKYGVDSVIIVEIPIETNSRNNTYPIYCSYGFHCLPAWEAFEEFLYEIIVIRQHFIHNKNISKMTDSLESEESQKFILNSAMYLVNSVMHPSELLCAVRKTNPFKLTDKRAYSKLEVIEIIKELVGNQYITDDEIEGIVEIIPFKRLNYKQLNDLYYQIILRNILKLCPRVARLKENQGKYKKNHESNLIYKAVEDFYISRNGKNSNFEKVKMEASQNENAELENRETNYLEEIRKLKEQLAKEEANHVEELNKLKEQKEQLEKREANHFEENRKLKENQEKYERQQNDLLRVVSELRHRLDKSQNELIDSISSNLNNLSFKYPNSREIQQAKKDLEKFEENVNVFE